MSNSAAHQHANASTNNMTNLILAPIRINQLTLPNRMIVPAMVTRLSGEDGLVNQAITDRYTRFARGEVGLIVVEATAVHQSKSGPLLRLGSDEFLDGHRELVARIHDNGPSKVALQIIHFLKIARSGWRQTVDMLSKDEIKAIIQAYADTAARVREAGYDAVELHMAHAYTLSSFLSTRNKRRDEYGGRSLETRLRVPSEVMLQVRQRVGDDYPIGVRFDAEECIKDGYGLNDAKYMALRLAQLGANYVSLSAGGKFEDAQHEEGEAPYPYTGYSGDRTMPPASFQDAPNVYLAAGVKAFLATHAPQLTTKVVTTGKIRTPSDGDAILQAGNADMIGFARALLADPDMPKKARLGRENTIVRCIYGNVCKQLDENFKQVRCGSLWPREFLHAPEAPNDDIAPIWPDEGAHISTKLNDDGRVRVTWKPAIDPQGVYGYEVLRASNGGAFEHVSSSLTTNYVDETALAGNVYGYCVRAYDFAGNRSVASAVAEIVVSPRFEWVNKLALNHESTI